MMTLQGNGPMVFILKDTWFSNMDIGRFHDLLDSDEKARSMRFHFREDRESYVIVHGLLRILLGNYFGMPAGSLRFGYSRFGKPQISFPDKKINFNLSHSAGVSVLAFDKDHEIGVDVEKRVTGFDYQPVAEIFFSRYEKQCIRVSGNDPSISFYRIWTRKEALLKAAGTGIGKNLDVEVLGKRTYEAPSGMEPGSRSGKFLLTTRAFRKDHMITVASDPGSGRISWQTTREIEPESILIA